MKATVLSGQWYADAEELESKLLGEAPPLPPVAAREREAVAAKKKEVAERLMEQYVLEYESSRRRSGDVRMLEMTARSGTSADKVSAFTCLVEDNPIANMRSLDALLSMVTSKVGKRYAFTGFEALKALFLLRLLPDRKLKTLLQRPIENLPETKDGYSLLLFWYWEECLKQRYEKFVIALEESLKDMLPNLKDKAMKTVYDLLKSKSEQERRLLTALVNKLGDPERKVASSAGYHLSRLLSTHPNMKAVVIQEVDLFIFRPHIGLRAKYQAVNFLNQILLSKKGDGPKIAKHLLDVYFALFKILISEGNDGKNMRKSSKFDDENSKKVKTKDKKGKVKAAGSLPTSKKEQSLESNMEMDSRLLSALLTGVNRAFPFLSSDEADDMIEVQTPVLFKLVHSENFNVGVQALMLLYQISSKNKIASDRFYRSLYSKILSPTALNSSKPEMFLGLLIKAMKTDINSKRVAAFSKRLLQVALQRPPQYACGCLFLLSEVLKANPSLWSMVLQNESADDDFEHFEDIIEDPESAIPSASHSVNSGGSALQNGRKEDYGCLGDDDDGSKEKSQTRSALPAGYDPRHREPSFCNADRASWWELMVLASHAHPSVATMARTLLSGANIVYNGDPINDLSLNAFLDKFMEKKPKPNKRAEGKWHGGSQIAPARKLDLNHHFVGDEILHLAEDEVPPEDVVFHRFYRNKTSAKKPKAKKKKGSLDDEDLEELAPDVEDSDEEVDLGSDATDNSEEEEIDNILGSGPIPLDEDKGDYEYDDLDKVVGEDDDDLLGDDSDADIGSVAMSEGSISDDDEDAIGDDGEVDSQAENGGSTSNDDESLDIWGDDANDSEDDVVGVRDDDGSQSNEKKKGKKRKSRPSPFASIEEYQHLMKEDAGVEPRKKSKFQKKRGK